MYDSITSFDDENDYQNRLSRCKYSIERFSLHNPYDFVNFFSVSFLDFVRLCEDLKLDSHYKHFRYKDGYSLQTSLNL